MVAPGDYMGKAKEAVADYFNERRKHLEYVDPLTQYDIFPDDVYVVWFCKTLQNFKALLSTNIPDGRYYEFTYDGDKERGYLDVYAKIHNEAVLDTGEVLTNETEKA